MTLLTSGFLKNCALNAGGLKNVWLANRKDIAAAGFTLSSGEYTAVTMESSAVFYKFEFDEDTAEFRPAGAFENNTALVNSEIEFALSGMSTLMMTSMQELLEVSACGMVGIAEDSNGVKWVIGYSESFPTNVDTQGRPLKARTIEATSGKALSDTNMSTVILGSNNTSFPLVFTGTVPV